MYYCTRHQSASIVIVTIVPRPAETCSWRGPTRQTPESRSIRPRLETEDALLSPFTKREHAWAVQIVL